MKKSIITYTTFILLFVILLISILYILFSNNSSKTYETESSQRIITKECKSITPQANSVFAVCIIEIDSVEYIITPQGGIFPLLPKVETTCTKQKQKQKVGY
jgi:hypothetical protein